MLSIDLWLLYVNLTITLLGIIHRPVCYLGHNISKTRFCPRILVEPTQLGPTDKAIICLRDASNTNTLRKILKLVVCILLR
jgi:hypothetical protein